MKSVLKQKYSKKQGSSCIFSLKISDISFSDYQVELYRIKCFCIKRLWSKMWSSFKESSGFVYGFYSVLDKTVNGIGAVVIQLVSPCKDGAGKNQILSEFGLTIA